MEVKRTQTTEAISSPSLFAGLDAVRAFAAVGVVALHACVPYLNHPMPGLAWSVRDTASPTLDFGFWSIELIVMPLFLVIAGFLAWQSLQRTGPTQLVQNRCKRLLIPLLFGMIIVLPLDLYGWVLGWVTEGSVPLVKLRSLKFDGVIDRDLWGLSHLWFLHYLFLYVVVLAISKQRLQRWKLRRSGEGTETTSAPVFQIFSKTPATSTWIALWCLATAIVLYFRPNVVWGFQHAFAPVPSKWIYHGLFFAAGVAVAVSDPRMLRLKTLAPRLALPSVLIAIATVRLGQWHVTQNSLGNEPSQFAATTLALMTPAAALATTLAIIGLAVDRIHRLPKSIQYLAAASFWIYLVHHPLLGLLHIDLKWMAPGVSPIIKAILASSVSIALSVATYEAWVRRSGLGRLLGFSFVLSSERVSASAGGARIDCGQKSEIEAWPSVFSIETARNTGDPIVETGVIANDDQPRRAA